MIKSPYSSPAAVFLIYNDQTSRGKPLAQMVLNASKCFSSYKKPFLFLLKCSTYTHTKKMQHKAILLSLLLCWLSVLASPSEALCLDPEQRGEARWTYLHRPCRSPSHKSPEYRSCWDYLRPTPGCSQSLFHSPLRSDIKLSPDCCSAVLRMPLNCFERLFLTNPFQRSFGPSVKQYCISLLLTR